MSTLPRRLASLLSSTDVTCDWPALRAEIDDDFPARDDQGSAGETLAFWRWLLVMAVETLAARTRESSSCAQELDLLLSNRPELDSDYAQMPIDAESTCRRAEIVLQSMGSGPILAVGDDDGCSIALALQGARDLTVVDVDPAIVAFAVAGARSLGASVELAVVDVFEPAPTELRGRYYGVITDPARDEESCFAFLRFSRECLSADPSARIFWADHPDWNLDFPRVVERLRELHLRIEHVFERVHRYQTEGWLPNFREKAAELRSLGVTVDDETLQQLFASTSAYSHLYVLRRDCVP